MNTPPTTEDRIWAVLSHLSALTLGMGIVLPILGWSDQRRKSDYAAFQCLQALGYQSVGFTIWLLADLVVVILGAIILLAITGPDNVTQGPGIIIFLTLVVGFFVLYLVLPIIAAIACALGKDFRYPLLGDRLARYLEYEALQKSEEPIWLNENQEFRWVAAMGHFSILIILWGMLAPLTAWILFRKHSFFLRFQSIQTLIYQASVTLLFLGGGFISGLDSIVAPLILGSMMYANPNSPMGIIGLVIIFAFILVPIFIILLIIPLFHILGQWAGYRVLKGDDYRYPLVGRLVEKWISKNSISEEQLK